MEECHPYMVEVGGSKPSGTTMKVINVIVKKWKKSDKFNCPNCDKLIEYPYKPCSCGIKIQVRVKLWFMKR